MNVNKIMNGGIVCDGKFHWGIGKDKGRAKLSKCFCKKELEAMQEFFDVGDYGSRQECIRVKNVRVKKLRRHGYKVVSSILKNQERGYPGFDTVRDSATRDILMITVLI